MKKLFLMIVLLALVACVPNTPVAPTSSATVLPTASFTSTATLTRTLSPTAVPASATIPPTGTLAGNTPTRMVTNTPVTTFTQAPLPTFTLTPTITPTNVFNGIRMNYFTLNKETRVYVPGEDVWFKFEVKNITNADVRYACIGALLNDKRSQCSWGDSTLKPGAKLAWEDHINWNQTGTYTIFGGVCFARDRNECDRVIDRNGMAQTSAALQIEIR